MRREFLGYANNPVEPEPTRKQLRDDHISERWEEIWDSPKLLQEALDDYGISFHEETVRLFSESYVRITHQLLSAWRYEMSDAESFVLALADDVDAAVLEAATRDVDNKI